MVKPDGIARGLLEEVKKRIKSSGLKIVDSKDSNLSIEEAEMLYSIHKGKTFYDGLVKFITSGPVCLMKLEGEDAIKTLRDIMGPTDPRSAQKGTIRGDFGEENIFTEYGSIKNIIHGSDSLESAKHELSIFF